MLQFRHEGSLGGLGSVKLIGPQGQIVEAGAMEAVRLIHAGYKPAPTTTPATTPPVVAIPGSVPTTASVIDPATGLPMAPVLATNPWYKQWWGIGGIALALFGVYKYFTK